MREPPASLKPSEKVATAAFVASCLGCLILWWIAPWTPWYVYPAAFLIFMGMCYGGLIKIVAAEKIADEWPPKSD